MGVAESKAHAAMGSRNSGQLATFGHERSERFARRTIGPEFEASAEERVGNDKDARICFGNRSSYRVSYWAMQDKPRSSAQQKRIVTDMVVALRNGNAGGTPSSGSAGRETEGTVGMGQETQGGKAQFLMRDQRIDPGAETRTADVNFPKDCRDLRVYGFFEEEEGEWQLFKDKSYSIGWFRKVITLTALDESISPYTKTRDNADAKDNPICAQGG